MELVIVQDLSVDSPFQRGSFLVATDRHDDEAREILPLERLGGDLFKARLGDAPGLDPLLDLAKLDACFSQRRCDPALLASE